MPTNNEIRVGIDKLNALALTWQQILEGGPTETVQAGDQTLPTVAKLIADLSEQIVTGLNEGYVLNVADNAGRTAAVPAAIGQFLFQRDNKKLYYSTALTAGSFTVHPYDSAAAIATQASNDVAAMATILAGKTDKTEAGAATPLFYEKTAAGSSTIPIPSGSNIWAEFTLIGGGGGAGGGYRSSGGLAGNSGYNCGGGGGGPGQFLRVLRKIPSGQTELTCIVGAAGIGGIGETPSLVSQNGTSGGYTRVTAGGDLYLNANGGNHGEKGRFSSTSVTVPGGAAHTVNMLGDQAFLGYSGSSSINGIPQNAEGIGTTRWLSFPTGGGAGGGRPTGNANKGGNGGGALYLNAGLHNANITPQGGAVGGVNGDNGVLVPGQPFGLGGGGGGNANVSGTNGGNGGTGSVGAGGGGGGCGLWNPSISGPGNGGAGGNGGVGYISVRFFRMPPV